MNDFFKFFEKLGVYSKSSIISVAVLMPFWYISIFLINRSLFYSIDITLRLVFVFCFSILLYFLEVFMLILDRSILDIEGNTDGCFKAAGFLSTFYLCGCLLIFYHTKPSFEHFLFETFVSVATISIVSTYVDYSFKRRRIKRNDAG